MSDGLFCKECPPGQYQEENGKEGCDMCPENFYCPTPTEKVDCPDGAKCPRGSTSPIFCPNLYEYDNLKQVFVIIIIIFMIMMQLIMDHLTIHVSLVNMCAGL